MDKIETIKNELIKQLKDGRTFMQRNSENFTQIFWVKLNNNYKEEWGDCMANRVIAETIYPDDAAILTRFREYFAHEFSKYPEQTVWENMLTYLSWNYYF